MMRSWVQLSGNNDHLMWQLLLSLHVRGIPQQYPNHPVVRIISLHALLQLLVR